MINPRGLSCIYTSPQGEGSYIITSIMGGFLCYKSEDNFAWGFYNIITFDKNSRLEHTKSILNKSTAELTWSLCLYLLHILKILTKFLINSEHFHPFMKFINLSQGQLSRKINIEAVKHNFVFQTSSEWNFLSINQTTKCT